jgi:hypothetical protein
MNANQRAEFRSAIRDELATVRVIDAALKASDCGPEETLALRAARSEAIAAIRFYLGQLTAGIARRKVIPCKPNC